MDNVYRTVVFLCVVPFSVNYMEMETLCDCCGPVWNGNFKTKEFKENEELTVYSFCEKDDYVTVWLDCGENFNMTREDFDKYFLQF